MSHTIATFKVDYLQFLDAAGNITQELPAFAQDNKNLIAMYRLMNLVRVMDAKAVNLQRMGKLGTFPSSLGQEAVSVGTGFAMQKTDIFAPYYRDQGAMIYRGVKISEILGFWGGDERCNNYTADTARNDFPIAVPIATQFLHAAGAAYAVKYHKEDCGVVCTGGEGSTSEGDFYEAMNFAGENNLPIVFVINNNQWAISVSRKLQTKSLTIAQKAIAAGFRGIQVDGNDIIAVRFAVADALAKAKSGAGPALIEAVTYRLADHTTADDAKRYVPEEEIKKAWQAEPLIRLRNYLVKQNVWSETDEKKMLAECTAEVDKNIEEYLKMPPAAPVEIIDSLYAELPAELQEQRDYLANAVQSRGF